MTPSIVSFIGANLHDLCGELLQHDKTGYVVTPKMTTLRMLFPQGTPWGIVRSHVEQAAVKFTASPPAKPKV